MVPRTTIDPVATMRRAPPPPPPAAPPWLRAPATTHRREQRTDKEDQRAPSMVVPAVAVERLDRGKHYQPRAPPLAQQSSAAQQCVDTYFHTPLHRRRCQAPAWGRWRFHRRHPPRVRRPMPNLAIHSARGQHVLQCAACLRGSAYCKRMYCDGKSIKVDRFLHMHSFYTLLGNISRYVCPTYRLIRIKRTLLLYFVKK